MTDTITPTEYRTHGRDIVSDFKAWSEERASLSRRENHEFEEGDDECTPDSDEWHGSDDQAVDLLRRAMDEITQLRRQVHPATREIKEV